MNIKDKLQRAYNIRPVEIGVKVLDVDEGSRTVTGIANTMLYFDHDADVIMPGAFSKSLKERGINSTGKAKIKHAMFHDMTRLAFKPQVIDERVIDGVTSLYFESVAADTTDGNDELEKYKMGIYDNHSIGFAYVQGKIAMFQKDTDEFKELLNMVANPSDMAASEYVFKVTEINLFEYSTVAIGANEMTPFLGMKSLDDVPAIRAEIEKRINKIQIATKGNFTDETHYLFELQLRQLKQMMYELTTFQPSIKDTLLEPFMNDTQKAAFDISKFKQLLIKTI